MTLREKIEEELVENEESALFADGFDEALLGISVFSPGRAPLVAYDYDACVGILVRRDKMTEEEAEEFMEYNVVGAWVGEKTPLFLRGASCFVMGDDHD